MRPITIDRHIDKAAFEKRLERVRVKVVKIDAQTNKPLKIYNSVSEAALAVDRANSSIHECLSGDRKTCGGFKWEKLKK